MCREFITIAQCAPLQTPFLSFTCGKLHMVAQHRQVCGQALGGCICFFGTCGNVEREISTQGIDLSGIAKVRCAGCTTREDNIGERRSPQQITESILLQRPAINPKDEAAMKKHMALIRGYWGNANACPFHIPPATPQSAAPSTAGGEPEQSEQQHTSASPRADTPTEAPEAACNAPDESRAASPAAPSNPDKDHSRKSSSGSSVKNGLDCPMGLETSRWASAPEVEKKPHSRKSSSGSSKKSSSGSNTKNGLDCPMGLQTSRWAPKQPEKSTEAPVKPAQEQPRAPPLVFTPDPNNADKVRSAAKKIAGIKAAFLVAQAAA